MKRQVIARKFMPATLPVTLTISTVTALDHFRAPGYAWGAVGVMLGLYWILAVVDICTERETDVLEGKR